MMQTTMKVVLVLFLATSGGIAHAEEIPPVDVVLSVSLKLGDSDILIDDPLPYKLLLRNRTRSLIYVAKRSGEGFTHFLDYRRRPSKEWVQAAEISAATKGSLGGDLAVGGEQTFAEYGKYFADKERKVIFSLAGDYDVRIRVKCLLGDFMTDTQLVHVGERPPAEVEAIIENMNVLRGYFDFFRFSDPPEKHFAKLRPKIHSGSIERTLQMFDGLSEFMKTQNVAGEKCTARVAYSKLSKGLDEVRRDQLAMAFIWNAMEAKQWNDVQELLPELSEDSEWRVVFVEELQKAVRRQLQKAQKP